MRETSVSMNSHAKKSHTDVRSYLEELESSIERSLYRFESTLKLRRRGQEESRDGLLMHL